MLHDYLSGQSSQAFTGVANCPARQVLYKTILISYFTRFIYRVIKSIPSPGGIGLSLVLGWHRCWKLSTARKASALRDRLDLIIHISYSSSDFKLGFFWFNMYFESGWKKGILHRFLYPMICGTITGVLIVPWPRHNFTGVPKMITFLVQMNSVSKLLVAFLPFNSIALPFF